MALRHPDFAGLHFTGSTATFQHLWRTIGENLAGYRAYPRIVGETGGKDFIVAHPSADPDVLRTAMIRGSFEYSGQKCSASSRAYVPRSVWDRITRRPGRADRGAAVGDVRDFSNFTSAVIDERAFTKHRDALDRARTGSSTEIIAGGTVDDQRRLVRPAVDVVSDDPRNEVLTTEYFGPILGVYVYDDADFEEVMTEVDESGPYGLTGAVIAEDRSRAGPGRISGCGSRPATSTSMTSRPAPWWVSSPSAAARASGTNDKAGSMWNLIRWASPRSIKETLVPAEHPRLSAHVRLMVVLAGIALRARLLVVDRRGKNASPHSSSARRRAIPAARTPSVFASQESPTFCWVRKPARMAGAADCSSFLPRIGMATLRSPVSSATVPGPPAASSTAPFMVTG